MNTQLPNLSAALSMLISETIYQGVIGVARLARFIRSMRRSGHQEAWRQTTPTPR